MSVYRLWNHEFTAIVVAPSKARAENVAKAMTSKKVNIHRLQLERNEVKMLSITWR